MKRSEGQRLRKKSIKGFESKKERKKTKWNGKKGSRFEQTRRRRVSGRDFEFGRVGFGFNWI